MAIRKETRRVLLNLLHLKDSSGILSVSHNTRGEGASETAIADTALVVADGVGESEAWGPGGAACGLVDVRCCVGGRLVGADDVEEGDVLCVFLGRVEMRSESGWIW